MKRAASITRESGAAAAVTIFPSLLLLFLLSGCGTVEDIRKNARNPQTIIEDVVPAAAFAGMGYKLLLPVGPERILLGLAYVIYDPLAPNWEIETIRISEDVFRMQCSMKRFHAGGEGEARYLFHRNARRIAQAAGYDDFRITRYEEGIESATFAPRRFGEGEIRLIRKP
jgi:hypothetical protein